MCTPYANPPVLAGDDEEEFPYDVEDDVWGTVEPLDDYKPGGFHPIIFGDRLGANGRFRVVSKLGAGGYGTVWLCEDTLSPTLKWRAVKVMSAKVSKPDCAELRTLDAFHGIDRSTLETDFHLSVPLEHFWIDGPNGRHLALVFSLCAATAESIFTNYGQHRSLIKDLCFQLAKSLELMHSRGFCHGDFRPSNILFRLRDGIDSLPETELLQHMMPPRPVRVISIEDEKPVTRASAPSVPEFLIPCTSILYHSGLCAAQLAVTDFGVSYSPSNPPEQGSTGIPTRWAAPEERFGVRDLLSYPSDIWSLGCVIAWLAMGFTPFGHEEDGAWKDELSINMEKHLGPMPEPFRAKFREDHDQETPVEELGKTEAELEPVTEIAKKEWQRRREQEMAGQKSGGHSQFGRDLLKSTMVNSLRTVMTAVEVKQMSGQLLANSSQLPFSDLRQLNSKAWPVSDDKISVQLEEREIDQLSDLLMSIFKWQPKDRAPLQHVLNHPWFEGRNRNAAKVPPPVATSNKSVVGETSAWMKSFLNYRSAARLLPGGFS
ncbi:kinase-like domain-containing protein [Copromyces sp. CBS 386.78]|nr:kinase-like domain-containing protein [Copromyces sp. CBS 386.78]